MNSYSENIIGNNYSDRSATSALRLRIRRGTVADAAHICALFEREYGDSSHPCLDERFVRNAIANKSEVWFVAENEIETVIGCLSVSYNAQNRSWEFGRGMISEQHRNMGILSTLMQSTIESMPIAAHDLTFAIARNFPALQATRNYVDVVLVGHDGSPNMVRGIHEYHAVTIGKFRSGPHLHYLPAAPVFSESTFLREQIFEPLGLDGTVGRFPNAFFWGHGDQFSDRFTYQFDERVGAIYLCQHAGGDYASTDEVIGDLRRFLAHHGGNAYVGAIVLADKLTLIKAMLELGFGMTAYLPAWHWHRGARYDCVLLARRQHEFANKNGLDAYIDSFDAAYQDIGRHILAA
ncbi:GNAT family N-acetyltransferase [Burkholderia ubonensis]|uniref:N-acetyltransferase domain-containing protein n=1 Tax=Burkholderia ubonensis subsp. mesacidophila TaxID=265293 RepID=A0A2A4F3R9_9BURK|nr:GNAT family N-acetyltransferase [Burkholderia ubonensis]PCE27234.1 hypothetical protein BZL54_30185 [Burkholderia ubonensis subsp. mesacidophila]